MITNDFKNFLGGMIQAIQQCSMQNPLVILDNYRIHDEDVLKSYSQQGSFEFMFLPPYSPNLSPIENVFSIIKQKFRSLMANKYKQQLINAQNAPRGQKDARKIAILDETFEIAIKSVTKETVNNCYGHLKIYLDKVRKYEDI